jgi:hypothetical protein
MELLTSPKLEIGFWDRSLIAIGEDDLLSRWLPNCPANPADTDCRNGRTDDQLLDAASHSRLPSLMDGRLDAATA